MLFYVVELVVFLIALLLEILLLKEKGKNIKVATLLLFLLILIVTFLLEKPQMDFKNYATVEVNSQILNPKTTYHFHDVTDKVERHGEIDTKKPGEYELEFEVDTLTGTYKKKQTIKVVDTLAPVITLEGDSELSISYKDEYEELGFSAIDEYDGDLTEKVTVSKKDINNTEYNLVYEVVDFSGNKAQKIRHVTLIDDVPPTIALNGNINIYMHTNEEFTEPGAIVTDEIDGDITDNLLIEGEVNTTQAGNYTITYKATDKAGNEAVAKRYVMVSANGKVLPQDGSNGEKGVIYLTFDDGPTTYSTPKILDILDRKGVKATFFILDFDEDEAELVKREYESGHTVAIHGYSHTYSKIYQSVDSYVENVTKLQEKIKDTIGIAPTITRFPGGSSNTVSRRYCSGIMTTLCYEMVSRGFTYFDWNVDSDDAGSAKNSNDTYRNVTNGLSKNQANVVLMHDFSGNDKTIDALEAIIDYGLENGYEFKAITEQTQMVTHITNN
jgi:peptidoglycan/xylan/chitin deacetylase (PgdA/CDA1 family)